VCVRVIVGDLESSTMRTPRPDLGYCAKERKLVGSVNYEAAQCTLSSSLLLVASS